MEFLDPAPDLSDRDHITYLSLGAGVQSTAMLAMSCEGLHDCPRADVAIFADTGDEPMYVYDQVKALTKYAARFNMPVIRVQEGCISEDTVSRHTDGGKKRVANIPVFTTGEDGKAAPLIRQCTRDYKIVPIETAVRRMFGVEKNERIGKRTATCMLGISIDEIQRMKDNPTKWSENIFPLIDAGISRDRCYIISKEAGLPEPQKSACYHCPYHGNAEWEEMRVDHPAEFARAVAFDLKIRDMSRSGVRNPVFLHRSLKPLGEVDFTGGQTTLVDWGMMEECDGMCGV